MRETGRKLFWAGVVIFAVAAALGSRHTLHESMKYVAVTAGLVGLFIGAPLWVFGTRPETTKNPRHLPK